MELQQSDNSNTNNINNNIMRVVITKHKHNI